MLKTLKPFDKLRYPNRIDDEQVLTAFKRLIDPINDYSAVLLDTLNAQSTAISKLPTLEVIQKQLSMGGSNPINVTGLLGTLQMPQAATFTGTHAKRLTTTPQLGAFFWETDRTVLYLSAPSGSATVWIYVAGVMSAVFSARPTSLTTNDAGFMLEVSDHRHLCRWDGTAWVILDNDAGTFIDSAVALGVGWQLCDGTATNYLTVSGADLAETAFTTPDEVTAPSGVYHKSIAAYTGTINAPTAPVISGSTGTPSATTTVDDDLLGTTVAVASSTHTHPVGTLVNDTSGQPRNLGVLRYFRR